MTSPPITPPPHRRPAARWKLAVGAVVALGAGAAIGAAGNSGATKTVAGPTRTVAGPTTTVAIAPTATTTLRVTTTPTKVVATRTRTATVTYTPTYTKYGEGLYVVGADIKPGTYHTEGGSVCYWARLSSLDTSDIIDNSLSSGPQTIQVRAGDRALQIRGDCTFGRK